MKKEKIIKVCSGLAFVAGLIIAFFSTALSDGGAPLKEIIITGIIAIAVTAMGVILGLIAETLEDSKRHMLHYDGEHEAGAEAYDSENQIHRIEDKTAKTVRVKIPIKEGKNNESTD